jgi:hypothetical protein
MGLDAASPSKSQLKKLSVLMRPASFVPASKESSDGASLMESSFVENPINFRAELVRLCKSLLGVRRASFEGSSK